jgi:hypothetical protein
MNDCVSTIFCKRIIIGVGRMRSLREVVPVAETAS